MSSLNQLRYNPTTHCEDVVGMNDAATAKARHWLSLSFCWSQKKNECNRMWKLIWTCDRATNYSQISLNSQLKGWIKINFS